MMLADLKNPADYVTRLDKSWSHPYAVDIAVLHTEKMTDGHIGNKAFKLSRVMNELSTGDRVLSFGGAWSNHLHALAYLCHQRGISTVGIIRAGESGTNALQASMQSYNMQVHPVSRGDYRRRDDLRFCEALCRDFGCCLLYTSPSPRDS